MKKCRNCKLIKDLKNFQNWIHPKNNKEYTRHTCRECINLKNKNKQTPAQLRSKAKREKKRRDDPAYRMYHGAKQRAKKQNLPFDIDQDYIRTIIPSHCPVLEIPLSNGEKEFHDNSLSLDRLVPSKGYTKGNVCVISDRANRLKRDATLDELKRLVFYMESKIK
jgi:CRISPR/Cas system CSM-associated protein Csm5 (group 7 of RAMP superfamily)